MPSIGVVGLGLMGTAIVKRLRGAGFDVVGYDVDADKRKRVAAPGIAPAETLAALSARCTTIMMAVFNTDQVEEVVERELLPGPGRIVICSSTCDPDRIAALAERVASRGLRFLEAPVSGSSGQVAGGGMVPTKLFSLSLEC